MQSNPHSFDRPSRFAAVPGDMKIPPPALYPSKPVQGLDRWRVSMVIDGDDWFAGRTFELTVWAYDSMDAVQRARNDFFGTWATLDDRKRLPLRVIEVAQVGT